MPPVAGNLSGAPRRVLWVEGKDDRAVVESLCAAHSVPETFRVMDRRGIEEVLRGFPLELRAADLERFGIVVDANGDAPRRWQAIRDALVAEGYPSVPDDADEEGTIVMPPERRPLVGIWIMPDNASPGMLEDFAAALIPASDKLWLHAAYASDQMSDEDRRFPMIRRAKAHIHTWLAWQEDPGAPMGSAITKRYLDADAPLAQAFVGWLLRLMG